MTAAVELPTAAVVPGDRDRLVQPTTTAAPTPSATAATAPAAGSWWSRRWRALASWRPQTASLLLQAIAGGALYLSYEGMHRLAVAAGYGPVQAAIWPLIVDGFVVHASRDVLRAWRARQTWRTTFDGFLILLAAGASAAFQASAAATERVLTDPPMLLVVGAHVVPPVAALLALALEVFAKYDRARRATSPGRAKPAGRPTGGPSSDGHVPSADVARRTRTAATADGDVARLARQVEDTFLNREVSGGERLVAAALAVELEGNDRRKRRVQEILRRLRTEPTPAQQARIQAARVAATLPSGDGNGMAEGAEP